MLTFMLGTKSYTQGPASKHANEESGCDVPPPEKSVFDLDAALASWDEGKCGEQGFMGRKWRIDFLEKACLE